MADNVAITAGAGTNVATDDIGGVHHQRMKISLGADGTANDLNGSIARGAYVDPRPNVDRIQATSTGLTTATTAYVTGDQLGGELTFTNAVRATGGTGSILSATLFDRAKVTGAVDLFLFTQTVTPAADNAAHDFSDSDMANCLGVIRFPAGLQTASNSISTIEVSGLAYKLAGTSLFGSMVTRTGHTFFGAVGDITVSLVLALD